MVGGSYQGEKQRRRRHSHCECGQSERLERGHCRLIPPSGNPEVNCPSSSKLRPVCKHKDCESNC